jgi:hypothetical protein
MGMLVKTSSEKPPSPLPPLQQINKPKAANVTGAP